MTESISSGFNPASFIARSQGSMVRSIRSKVNCSNFALVMVMTKCRGPDASAVINGKLTSVWSEPDNSIFAFSAASFKRCRAI